MQDLLVKLNKETQKLHNYNVITNTATSTVTQMTGLLNMEESKEKKDYFTTINETASLMLNHYRSRIFETNDEIKKINKQITEMKRPQECKTINDLYKNIENEHQVRIFEKILTDVEYRKIYLSGYEENKDRTKKNRDLIGTIKVLGTFNMKKQEREEYDIKIFNQADKGTFWCNCPDNKFNSSKKGTVCKHICFIVCKIMRILRPSFFVDKKLTQEELDKTIAKLTTSNIWTDNTVVQKLQKISLETFMNFVKELEDDDSCPVCYENMEKDKKHLLLACPACRNYVHRECNDVWMERHDDCVYCKNDIWKQYKKIK